MSKRIAIFWDCADVQSLRPDLNDDQAYEVLLAAKKHHDASEGINWDVLSLHADNLFPEPVEESEWN